MTQRKIELHARPARPSHESGKIEQNNGIFKVALEKIKRDDAAETKETMVDRSSFLTNKFHGLSTPGAFQLAREHAPLIIGIPNTVVPKDVLHAHIQIPAARALQNLFKCLNSSGIAHNIHKTGKKVWVWYDTSANDVHVEWDKQQ